MTTTESTPKSTRQPQRRWPIIAAAAALVAVVVGALVLAARDDEAAETPTTAAAPTTVAPEAAAADALEIAGGILNWRHDDPDRAMRYLTDDAIAAASGTREAYRLEGAMLHALGDNAVNVRCEVQDESAAGIVVRCTYDLHTFRSEERGREPFTGGFDTFTIRDGTIVASGESRNPDGTTAYFTDAWDQFRRWVLAEHPDDVATMYDGNGWRLTPESIALWEQHTLAWAQDQKPAE